MLITKYSLNSSNNTVVVPDNCRFLGLGVDTLPLGRDRPYVKIGIFQSAAMWAHSWARFSNTPPMTPSEIIQNFKTVRIVLVPNCSTMNYHTVLEHNVTRNVLLSLGSLTLKSSKKETQYDGYAIVPISEEDSNNHINASTRSATSGVINETTLTRQIL